MALLKDKGPLRLPEITTALGLEQKDVGSAFGILSKEGLCAMDGEKRAALIDGSRASPRIAAIRSLFVKALASGGLLSEPELSDDEKSAMAGIARKRGAGDAPFRAAEREVVHYSLCPDCLAIAEELRAQGVTGEEIGAVTSEVLEKGLWKKAAFRPYNINSPTARLIPGRRNAYVEFLESVKDKLASLGFEEFDGGLVETEFWNGDAPLYAPIPLGAGHP